MAGAKLIYTDGRAAKNLSLTNPNAWEALLKGGDPSAKGRISVMKAWQAVDWFRRCVDVRATVFSSVPWEIRRAGTDNVLYSSSGDTAETPPEGFAYLADLQSWLYRIEACLVLEGAAYALRLRTRGRSQGLQWFNPTTIEPQTTPQGITHYRRDVNGLTKDLPERQVFAIFAPDPYAEIGPGNAAAAAVLPAASTLYSLQSFLTDHLDRGLIKATVFSVPGNTPEPERDRLFQWVNKMFGKGYKSEKNQVLSADVTPTVIGDGMSDLSDVDLTAEQRQGIATGLGVPHSIVESSAANYATANAEMLGFLLHTIVPRSKYVQNAFNRGFFGGLGMELRFIPERLEALQAYELEKAQSIQLLTGGKPILTPSEAREMLGREPLPDEELPMPTPIGDDAGKRADVSAWRSKVQRRGRSVKFTPNHLSEIEAAVIRERLASPAIPLSLVFSEVVGF